MDKDWGDDPANPQNWSNRKRIPHTLIVAWIAFTCTLASSIYAPAHDAIQHQFGVSSTVAVLPLSLYVLGLGFGPPIAVPTSETFGRRLVYLTFMPIFALFTLGAGLSNDIASLCVCRLLAGIFACPGLSIGTASIADLWAVPERAVPMALYAACPFLGPALGPLIGSFVVQERSWHWTLWVICFACVPLLIGALCMSETYKKAILKARKKRERQASTQSENSALEKIPRAKAFHAWAKSTLTRPLHMLVTEPIVAVLSLYIGLTFAVLYSFYTITPTIFSKAYGFDLGQQGLTYTGMAIGIILAFGFLSLWSVYIYKPRVVSWRKEKSGPPPAEWRVLPMLVGSPFLPAGLFLFGWTAEYRVHWIAPVLGMAFFVVGTYLCFLSVSMYITDCYGPSHGASAMAGQTMLRYALGAVFPLFALQMFSALGVDWASTLLGLLTTLLGVFPWLLLWIGPTLRQRQKYANTN